MQDRQDIDALLIGALYGELTPADEARLTAHLESHPADKTALDDLKTARARVVESRIFELQSEPPQAISAVLLQEAARRAPRRAIAHEGEARESWFHRFVRTFAAHPAMAAAAMLVLVVGVAGTLYMKNGAAGFADKTAGSPAQAEQESANLPSKDLAMSPSAGMVAGDASAVASAVAAAGSAASGYDVRLDEQQQALDRKEAELAKSDNAEGKADRAKVAIAAPEPTDGVEPPKKQAVAHSSKKGKDYIEVTTPQQMPKEMPSAEDKSADGDFAANNGTRGAVGGGAAGNTANVGAATGSVNQAGPAPGGAPATTVAASPPPPPPAVKYAPSKPTAPTTKSIAKAPAPAPQQDAPVEAQPPADTSLIAWAKNQHAAARAKVKAGDCSGAAQLVVVVRNQAFGYYQQNMQNDRDLKGCASYIADAVNKDEERASKPKAAKRAADDEAPAAVRSK